jgi:hypothetical protein
VITFKILWSIIPDMGSVILNCRFPEFREVVHSLKDKQVLLRLTKFAKAVDALETRANMVTITCKATVDEGKRPLLTGKECSEIDTSDLEVLRSLGRILELEIRARFILTGKIEPEMLDATYIFKRGDSGYHLNILDCSGVRWSEGEKLAAVASKIMKFTSVFFRNPRIPEKYEILNVGIDPDETYNPPEREELRKMKILTMADILMDIILRTRIGGRIVKGENLTTIYALAYPYFKIFNVDLEFQAQFLNIAQGLLLHNGDYGMNLGADCIAGLALLTVRMQRAGIENPFEQKNITRSRAEMKEISNYFTEITERGMSCEVWYDVFINKPVNHIENYLAPQTTLSERFEEWVKKIEEIEALKEK